MSKKIIAILPGPKFNHEASEEEPLEPYSNDSEDMEEEYPGTRPEPCALPFAQQCLNVKRTYSTKPFAKKPLLPPYTEKDITAFETKYGFEFPPLFRFYLLHVSRETSFSFYRNLVQPESMGPYYQENLQMEKDYAEKHGEVFTPVDQWTHHMADHGCTFDETIWFTGKYAGLVKKSDDMYAPWLNTIYDRLMCANPSNGKSEQWREPNTAELPSELIEAKAIWDCQDGSRWGKDEKMKKLGYSQEIIYRLFGAINPTNDRTPILDAPIDYYLYKPQQMLESERSSYPSSPPEDEPVSRSRDQDKTAADLEMQWGNALKTMEEVFTSMNLNDITKISSLPSTACWTLPDGEIQDQAIAELCNKLNVTLFGVPWHFQALFSPPGINMAQLNNKWVIAFVEDGSEKIVLLADTVTGAYEIVAKAAGLSERGDALKVVPLSPDTGVPGLETCAFLPSQEEANFPPRTDYHGEETEFSKTLRQLALGEGRKFTEDLWHKYDAYVVDPTILL